MLVILKKSFGLNRISETIEDCATKPEKKLTTIFVTPALYFKKTTSYLETKSSLIIASLDIFISLIKMYLCQGPVAK